MLTDKRPAVCKRRGPTRALRGPGGQGHRHDSPRRRGELRKKLELNGERAFDIDLIKGCRRAVQPASRMSQLVTAVVKAAEVMIAKPLYAEGGSG